jgi:putative membrane protein insertion efficiency factor
MTWDRRIGHLIVHAYQLVLGPFMGGTCRFEPSCSTYALEAIDAHGLLKGLALALRRVAKCHPFSPPGIDPVPPGLPRSE